MSRPMFIPTPSPIPMLNAPPSTPPPLVDRKLRSDDSGRNGGLAVNALGIPIFALAVTSSAVLACANEAVCICGGRGMNWCRSGCVMVGCTAVDKEDRSRDGMDGEGRSVVGREMVCGEDEDSEDEDMGRREVVEMDGMCEEGC